MIRVRVCITLHFQQKGTPVKSPPMSPDVDKENTGGRNQAPLRGRKRRSPEKWLQHKPEGTMDTGKRVSLAWYAWFS